MSNILRILLIEDRPDDAELILSELRRTGFKFEWERVEKEEDYLAQLDNMPDVILADYNLPQFSAPRALKILKDRDLDIPFILVTGSVGEESVVDILKQGASDYLLKDRLGRLGQAVTRTLQEKRLSDEKRQAETAMRESEAKFRTLFENSPMGICISRDLIRLYANRAYGQMIGFEDGISLIGLPILDQVVPDYRKLVETLLEKSQTNAKPVEAEIFLQRRDGGDFPVHVQISQIVLPDGPATVAFVTDVTERHRVEEALGASEIRFRILFENSPVGISIQRGQTLLYANRTMANMYGYLNASELINLPFLTHVAPEYREDVRSRIESGRQTMPISLDTVGQRKNGTTVPIHLEIGLIMLPDGPAYVVFSTDITHRKRLEEETLRAETLKAELEKEKELAELKDRFTSMVSHEFRTPLTVIRMSSELMANFPQRFSDERKLKFLNEIQTQVKYMVQLLEDVLIIGKAKANKLEFEPKLVDVNAFSHGIFEELQLADDGKHRFIFVNDSQVQNAYLDERLVRHILMNLLSNAAKYSPNGGDVRFEVSRKHDQFIFSISDQGIGIPKEDYDRLFEAFHRAKNVKNIQGTGLGLAIVKNHVEMHGGTISFESEPGVGTTFTVRLPVISTVTESTSS